MDGVTRHLARLVRAARVADCPGAVRDKAVRLFVNWVGCALGGASHPAMDAAVGTLDAIGGPARATVLGRGIRTDIANATLLNGLAASAHAFDDTHLPTVAHPTAPAAAALLAFAETRAVAGADFVHALALSVEIQCRLGIALAVPPARTHVGHYMTGITGAPGVAASLAKLMGLDEQQTIWAIGLAAAHGAGFRATHASMASAYVPGHAGRSGVVSALLAAQGFTGNEAMLEGRNGFGDVYGTPAHLEALVADWGERWECLQVAEKPWPSGVFIHPAIEACLALAADGPVGADDIQRLHLRVHPLATGLTGRPEPRNAYDAQVSLYHWAAAALADGEAGLAQACDAAVRDPRIVALRGRITVEVDPDLQADEAVAELNRASGVVRTVRVSPCSGSGRRPMTDAELDRKFLRQAGDALDRPRAQRLLEACRSIATATDVRAAAPGFWG